MSILELSKTLNKNPETSQTEEANRERTVRPRLTPAADIYSDEEKYVLLLDLPGVKETDLEISLEKDELRIEAKTTQPTVRGELRYSEYGTGDFRRSFAVSEQLEEEKISATFKNGILKVTLPRRKPASKKIEVQVD
ncbi:Hsp20/alpha crystallin family protein [Leptospira fletcheri]|uniref:Hsp20/alpha crystallin family protein n=1 Tax=Leptospira fletcheri TaxID=2484981 RepID=A0A4R9GDN8_9LEPT|nr:Hsp20/alpha crystallin family protein [Leptospira fletcheri]TGK09968.1 Hsp20/alpha crystallin family protein [Leptospira fletcheri]